MRLLSLFSFLIPGSMHSKPQSRNFHNKSLPCSIFQYIVIISTDSSRNTHSKALERCVVHVLEWIVVMKVTGENIVELINKQITTNCITCDVGECKFPRMNLFPIFGSEQGLRGEAVSGKQRQAGSILWVAQIHGAPVSLGPTMEVLWSLGPPWSFPRVFGSKFMEVLWVFGSKFLWVSLWGSCWCWRGVYYGAG